MKNGRLVWLVSGNISEEGAKNLIQSQKQGLPLNPIEVKDLLGARVINPVGNHKVNMKVTDEKNDNSAMVSYYQYNIHESNIKKELIFSLVCKYIAQPYFNELRTNQQLGYVVHAAEYNPRLI